LNRDIFFVPFFCTIIIVYSFIIPTLYENNIKIANTIEKIKVSQEKIKIGLERMDELLLTQKNKLEKGYIGELSNYPELQYFDALDMGVESIIDIEKNLPDLLNVQTIIDIDKNYPDLLTDEEVDILLSYTIGKGYDMIDHEVDSEAQKIMWKVLDHLKEDEN